LESNPEPVDKESGKYPPPEIESDEDNDFDIKKSKKK